MARSQAPAADSTETQAFDDSTDRDNEMGAAIAKWTEELIEGVQEAEASAEFQEWLDVQSAFHDYSFRNTLLIKMQRPDATRVAGFWSWKNNFDRSVKKGEDAIWIWGPITAAKCPECGNAPGYHDYIDCTNDEDGTPEEWSEGVVGFQPVSVFDVSQTEGEPLPELDTSAAAGNLEDPAAFRQAVMAAGESLAVAHVETVPADEWTHKGTGVAKYDSEAATVQAKGGRPSADVAKTLIHEYAHAELHDPTMNDDERHKREVEAEAVAYTVGRHFGLDMSGSELYVASWSEDSGGEIRDRLDRISRTAETIIEAVDAAHDDAATEEA